MIVRLTLCAAALTVTAAIPIAGVAPAVADDQFGQHVRSCAQTMGFDGEHNPGMHQGARGWSPEHTC